MGNMIYFEKKFKQTEDYIKMSNSLTSCFLHSLILSGSRLASTDSQKLLMVYLGTQNQSFRGIGTVSFDITEMPWKIETFEADKQFMLNTIAKAKDRLGCEVLGYHCKSEFLFPRLDIFRRLIEHLEAGDVDPAVYNEWLTEPDINSPVIQGFPLCEQHHVYLSIFGCLVCTD